MNSSLQLIVRHPVLSQSFLAEINAGHKSADSPSQKESFYSLVLQLARQLISGSTDATPVANLVRDKLTKQDCALIQQDWNEGFEWLLEFLVEGSGSEVLF